MAGAVQMSVISGGGLTEAQLAGYLDRIGLATPPAPDLAGLSALVEAHRASIPFENYDVLLGRGVSLDRERLFDKLVTRRRGGYCFEQNGLFGDVLATLGFDARALLGRVWLMNEGGTPPRTHTLLVVTIDGVEWTADVGFGGSYVPPLRLVADEVVETADGARHRLRHDAAHGWMLERQGSGEWQPQYSFTTDPVFPADLELSNHYTGTAPGTRFLVMDFAGLALQGGSVMLVRRQYSRHGDGEEAAAGREVTDPAEYRAILSDQFGIGLSAEEVAALPIFTDS